jgi:hypothetical protein
MKTSISVTVDPLGLLVIMAQHILLTLWKKNERVGNASRVGWWNILKRPD